jgi:2-phosphosulfolactate phosphatase
MKIELLSLLEGARRAEGTVVIVDVLRAFTTAAVAFERGAKHIVMVAGVDDARRLQRRGAGDLVMGEVDGRKPDGFDFGNSPHEMSRADVRGKTLIQSTRAGTTGIESAARAKRIYAASFAVAGATARAILRDRPATVSIVAMGQDARERSDEDELCAMYLRNLLEGRKPDFAAVRRLALVCKTADKFRDPSRPWFHPLDLTLALTLDLADFAIRVRRRGGLLVAEPVRV